MEGTVPARWVAEAFMLRERSILAAFFFTCVISACGGSTAPAADEPQAEAAEGALTKASAPMLGRWRSDKDTYFKTVGFRKDGSFIGYVNVERLDGDCSRAIPLDDSSDCTEITIGRFRVSRATKKLTVDVNKLVEVTPAAKTLTFSYELADDGKKLVIDGTEGKQTFAYFAGCEEKECTGGKTCVEKENWTGASCERRSEPVPH
jgi:hypothetical protein